MVKSCLKWIGGKSKNIDKYLEYILDHKIFTSPFCRAYHVELAKESVRFELVNDKNDKLINFLMMLRDNSDELSRICAALPYSEYLYEKYKRKDEPQDPLERAVGFFYILRCGFSVGGHKYKTGFSITVTQGES